MRGHDHAPGERHVPPNSESHHLHIIAHGITCKFTLICHESTLLMRSLLSKGHVSRDTACTPPVAPYLYIAVSGESSPTTLTSSAQHNRRRWRQSLSEYPTTYHSSDFTAHHSSRLFEPNIPISYEVVNFSTLILQICSDICTTRFSPRELSHSQLSSSFIASTPLETPSAARGSPRGSRSAPRPVSAGVHFTPCLTFPHSPIHNLKNK